MTPHDASAPIVLAGTWLYDGTVRLGVRITATAVRFGTGDGEDPPEIRDDIPVHGFGIAWEQVRGGWTGGGSTAFESLAEAKNHVAKLTHDTVRWEPEG